MSVNEPLTFNRHFAGHSLLHHIFCHSCLGQESGRGCLFVKPCSTTAVTMLNVIQSLHHPQVPVTIRILARPPRV